MNKDKLITILTVILIGVLLVLLQGCKHKEEQEEIEIVPEIKTPLPFEGTFKIEKVALDAVDVTNAFKSMSITFTSEKTYSVTNPVSPIWPPNGSFSYENSQIKRNDGINVSINSLTDAKMILELFYTPSSARATGVKGKYVFEMVK